MRVFLKIAALLVFLVPAAHAQFGPQWSGENPPRNGACFYSRSEFRGMYFCVGAGDSYTELPNHFRRRISSIRIRGLASIQLFDQIDFKGQTLKAEQNIPDLSKLEFALKRSWNDRALSLRVVYDPARKRPARTAATALSTRPKQGACFFTEAGFHGRSICLQTGESLDRLPQEVEKNILSVRVYGHADVVIYDDRGFGGATEHLWSSVPDLTARGIPGDNYRTWDRRIASVEIR